MDPNNYFPYQLDFGWVQHRHPREEGLLQAPHDDELPYEDEFDFAAFMNQQPVGPEEEAFLGDFDFENFLDVGNQDFAYRPEFRVPPIAGHGLRADNDDDEDLSDLDDDAPPGGIYPVPTARHASEEIPASLLQQTWPQQQVTDSIRQVFPDISRRHVAELYEKQSKKFVDERLCEAILEAILETPRYPKERDEQEARKAALKANVKTFREHKYYAKLCQVLLKDEFRDTATESIKAAIAEHKTIALAYVSLKSSALTAVPKRGKRRKTTDLTTALQMFAKDLVEFVQAELAEARLQQSKPQEDMSPAAEGQSSEADADLGPEVECACCFGDMPQKKSVYCAGKEPHVFCLDCLKRNVETEIGNRRCKLDCMDMSGCKAAFADHQIRLAVDQKTMDHLLRLRQQDDLKEAGIEGIAECPFCDYMEVYPPIEQDREFRCGNDDCKRITCRMCKKDSHTPLNCEEAVKENKLDARHILEEALSDALIRKCNSCETKFVKIDGCNKMTCPKCSNHQCYCCGDTIKGYDHFEGGRNPKKCVTYDQQGIEWRHSNDVKKAEETVKARLREQQPDVSEEDLNIQVSDAVKQKEAQQAARAGQNPMHMRHPMLLQGLPLNAGQMPPMIPPVPHIADPAMAQRVQALWPRNEQLHQRHRDILHGAQLAQAQPVAANPSGQPGAYMPYALYHPLGGQGLDPALGLGRAWDQMYGPLEGVRGQAQQHGIEDRLAVAREQRARAREQNRERATQLAEQQRQRLADMRQQTEARQQDLARRTEQKLARMGQRVQAQEEDFQPRHGMTAAQAFRQRGREMDERIAQMTRLNQERLERVTQATQRQLDRMNQATDAAPWPFAAAGAGFADPFAPRDGQNAADGAHWGYDQDLFPAPGDNPFERLVTRHRNDQYPDPAPNRHIAPVNVPHPPDVFLPTDSAPPATPKVEDGTPPLKVRRHRHEAGMGRHLRKATEDTQPARTRPMTPASALGIDRKNDDFGFWPLSDGDDEVQEAPKPKKKKKRDIVDLTADSGEEL